MAGHSQGGHIIGLGDSPSKSKETSYYYGMILKILLLLVIVGINRKFKKLKKGASRPLRPLLGCATIGNTSRFNGLKDQGATS